LSSIFALSDSHPVNRHKPVALVSLDYDDMVSFSIAFTYISTIKAHVFVGMAIEITFSDVFLFNSFTFRFPVRGASSKQCVQFSCHILEKSWIFLLSWKVLENIWKVSRASPGQNSEILSSIVK